MSIFMDVKVLWFPKSRARSPPLTKVKDRMQAEVGILNVSQGIASRILARVFLFVLVVIFSMWNKPILGAGIRVVEVAKMIYPPPLINIFVDDASIYKTNPPIWITGLIGVELGRHRHPHSESLRWAEHLSRNFMVST